MTGNKETSASNADAGHELVERFYAHLRRFGTLLLSLFHYIGLILIGGATVWAAGFAFFDMMRKPHIGVEELLLLFIYLEIGAMVGIYFKTNHMPVRFLLYVAITAVTRHLIGVLNHSKGLGLELLVSAGTLLILAIALLAVRFASFHYSTGPPRPVSFKSDLD